jgi:hypothetical protein
MVRRHDQDFDWLALSERPAAADWILSSKLLESDRDTRSILACQHNVSPIGTDAGRNIDAGFRSLDSLLDLAVADLRLAAPVIASTPGESSAVLRRRETLTAQPRQKNGRRPSFYCHLFFFASSATAALTADLTIFRIAGVDVLALFGRVGSYAALPVILGLLALSSLILATGTYIRAARVQRRGGPSFGPLRRRLVDLTYPRRAMPDDRIKWPAAGPDMTPPDRVLSW